MYLVFVRTFCVLPFSIPTNIPPTSFSISFFEVMFCICQIYRTPMRGIWFFKTQIRVCFCIAQLVDITLMHIPISSRRTSIPNNPENFTPFFYTKKIPQTPKVVNGIFCPSMTPKNLPCRVLFPPPFLQQKNPTDTQSGDREFSAYAKSGEWDSSRLNSPIAIPPKRENQPPSHFSPTHPNSKYYAKNRQKTSKKVEANAHPPRKSQ